MRQAIATVVAAVMAMGLGLGLAPAAEAVENNDTLVQAWYRQFLGRSYDEARSDDGRWYWVAKLDAGERPSDVLWQITHSREYVQREVSDSYNDLLGRAPDAGAAYWIDNAVDRGMSLEWIRQIILASQEYYDDWYTKEFVVDDWYSDMLGRYEASSGEENYWLGRARRVGRLQAVREIYYSDEAVRHRINGHYRSILYRGADFSGIAYWYPKEVENDVNVQVLLASTPEFVGTRVF